MIEADNPNFDEVAKTYEEYRVGYSRTLYEALEELGFRPGTSVLDVGCGTGIASAPLEQRGMKITGVDPSERMLAHARIRIATGKFVVGKAEALPFGDDEFDAALAAQAVHWFDQPKALAEMARVVKPGGRVAIWWKKLMVDDSMRALRSTAAAAAGIDEPGELMPGAFKAFYLQPFKQRWLRVVPYTITSDAKKWMGYERSRRRAKSMHGSKHDAYLAELEKQIVEKGGERPFQVRYTQYLYVGEVE